MIAAVDRRRAARWVAPSVVLCAYALLLVFTASADPGDTRDYANSIADRFAGRDLNFWESGHLLWRPLGYVFVIIAHPLRTGIAPAMLYADIVHSLTAISIAMGAVALLAFVELLRRMELRPIPAVGATIAMGMSCAFLNYAATGTAYIPSLAMLIVALLALARADGGPASSIVLPGLAFAACVLFWLPMVLVVPVAAASQIILRGDSRSRRVAAMEACVLSGALVVAAYLSVAVIKHIHSLSGLRAWLTTASHGIHDSGGVSRAAIGLARSVMSMQQLGVTAKRHMLGDPFAPATLADVVRAGLARIALFYAAMGVLVVRLAWRRQVRVLAFLVLTAVPVLVFAIAWQGGDLERYVALFPALFFAIAVALSSLSARTAFLCVAAMLAALAVFNLGEFSRAAAARTCAVLSSRLLAVPTVPGRPAFVATMSADELTRIRGRCPDSPALDRPNPPQLFGLFTPHVADADQWRRAFAERALNAWAKGGRVWISARLLESRPPEDWHWAEGDDPRVHWEDFPAFFNRLGRGELGRGDNPFVEVAPSPANKAILDGALHGAR